MCTLGLIYYKALSRFTKQAHCFHNHKDKAVLNFDDSSTAIWEKFTPPGSKPMAPFQEIVGRKISTVKFWRLRPRLATSLVPCSLLRARSATIQVSVCWRDQLFHNPHRSKRHNFFDRFLASKYLSSSKVVGRSKPLRKLPSVAWLAKSTNSNQNHFTASFHRFSRRSRRRFVLKLQVQRATLHRGAQCFESRRAVQNVLSK